MGFEGIKGEVIYDGADRERLPDDSLLASSSPLAERLRMYFTEDQLRDFEVDVFTMHDIPVKRLASVEEYESQAIAAKAASFFEITDKSKRRALAKEIATMIDDAS